MTERERLAKLIESAMYWGYDMPDKIADYLIAHGTCVIPYKPDQPVWLIDKGYVHECRVRNIKPYYGGMHLLELDDKTDWRVLVIELEAVEDSLFFSREEAEAALEERHKSK